MTYLQLILHTAGLVGKQNILKDGSDLQERRESVSLALELLSYIKMAVTEVSERTNLCIYLLEQTADGKGKIILSAEGREISAIKAVYSENGDRLPFTSWGEVLKVTPYTPCLIEVYAKPHLPEGIGEADLQSRPDIPTKFELTALCYLAASLYFAVQNQLGLAAYWQQRFDEAILRTYGRHRGGNLMERMFR